MLDLGVYSSSFNELCNFTARLFYLHIDCNCALLSWFWVFEAIVYHMIANDVHLHLHLGFISICHHCIFAVNVVLGRISWRFLICMCWRRDLHTAGAGRSVLAGIPVGWLSPGDG